MAMSAPTPSSQARVGSEKKAQGAATSVHSSDSANEATTVVATTSHRRDSVSSSQAEEDDQRPEEVELLLDAERPEVQQRRGRRLGPQVVDGVRSEAEVGDVERRRRTVAGDVREAQLREDEPRRGDRDHDRQQGRRQQPPEASRVEHDSGRCVRFPFHSRTSRPVMRNPEMTKKTSTPMKPPVAAGTPAWNSKTAPMAMARRPSISGRK